MNLGKLKVLDISLIKFSVLFGAFFLVSVWSGLASWVISTHWAWFLVAAIVFAIKPMITVLKK